jgi:hypothetical protein
MKIFPAPTLYPITLALASLTLCAFFLSTATRADENAWKPGKVPLMTRWGKEVTPDNAWTEYPRPQMVRQNWKNLNGLWELAIIDRGSPQPAHFPLQILVPYGVESSLSGVTQTVLPSHELWYRRTFELESNAEELNTLLHFGAVDWEATVWVNGHAAGTHRGGSTPFTLDITPHLTPNGKQEVVLRVWDPTDEGAQPRGKQQLRPEGIWYTPVSGIWQTVWMEQVPKTYVRNVLPTCDIDQGLFTVQCDVVNAQPDDKLIVTVSLEGTEVAKGTSDVGPAIPLKIASPKLWTPDSPTLYAISIRLTRGDKTIDTVGSYSAMREISVGPDDNGVLRLLLNHEPLFHYGPLDQGWWPDGLLTPPSDEAMRYDLEILKSLGMNMLRKHIKVEPSRLYFHCDQLGLLVWQDMPSSMQKGRKHFVQPNQVEDAEYTVDEKQQFRIELKEMLDHLRFFPCIVVWVPFNEGWGQHDTNEVLAWVKQYDPSRLVNGPSGWTDRGYGDMKDMHNYPGPNMFPVMKDRVSVLGEFGGLGLPIAGHLWKENDNWGYRTYRTQTELDQNYLQLMRRLYPLIGEGLAAAVYTQTTDVEIEVNGLMTYDREVLKIRPELFAQWHKRLLDPIPKPEKIIPDARGRESQWKYVTQKPGEGWEKTTFNDANWKQGPGGFGTPETPNTTVRTRWDSSDLWLRSEWLLDREIEGELYLSIHHDEDAEIFINGILAAKVTGFTTDYILVPINEDAKRTIAKGKNSIAVHCHQTGGGQYIDLGLMTITAPPRKSAPRP